MTRVAATARPGPMMQALIVAGTTAAAAALPSILMFSWLSELVDMTNVAPLPSIAIGLSMAFVVLALPAAGWGWVVARMANQPAWPIIRTTLRVALPTFAVVGIAVDFSQFFIDYVWRWHRLAVHGLFALSFAVGMAIFLGMVTWRIARVITQNTGEAGSGPTPRRIGLRVTLATGLGVIAGALLALPLGWAVVGGMGRQMLAPLYLVLATGTCAGGVVFGRWLAHFHETRQRTSHSHSTLGAAMGPSDVRPGEVKSDLRATTERRTSHAPNPPLIHRISP